VINLWKWENTAGKRNLTLKENIAPVFPFSPFVPLYFKHNYNKKNPLEGGSRKTREIKERVENTGKCE
jgi:hypothetical protein